MSKGEDDLGDLLESTFPTHKVVRQYPIKIGSKTLYLDYYIPTLAIAAEFDGNQHDEFVPHFHKSKQLYLAAQDNDTAKAEWCREHSVRLLRFKNTEKVDLSSLYGKISQEPTD